MNLREIGIDWVDSAQDMDYRKAFPLILLITTEVFQQECLYSELIKCSA